MEFRKKLRYRIIASAIILIIGIVLNVLSAVDVLKNEFFGTLGFTFIFIGALRIIKTYKSMTDEEQCKQEKIKETDERNLKIWGDASRFALSVYGILVFMAVVVCEILGKSLIADVLSISLCALFAVYLIFIVILSKKY